MTGGWAKRGRDIVLVTFAMGLGLYEIVFAGARPAVLTFLSGILLAPIVIRVDEARRNGRDDQ